MILTGFRYRYKIVKSNFFFNQLTLKLIVIQMGKKSAKAKILELFQANTIYYFIRKCIKITDYSTLLIN